MAHQGKVFILGASGFIGKHLLEQFSLAKEFITRGFSSRECNLLAYAEVRKILSQMNKNDNLIIAAAITRLRDDSYSAMLKNIEMIHNISRFLSRRPLRHVTYLSTVDVYGISVKGKIRESLLVNPYDYYSISKVASEFLLRRTCFRNAIPLAILRLTGVYGPGDNGKSTLWNLLNSAVKNREIFIYGDGKNMRNYLYVRDLYKITRQAIIQKTDRVVNVASPQSYSIVQIIEILKRQLPFKVKVTFRPENVGAEERLKHMRLDCSLLEREFPCLKMTRLKDGICQYISEFLKTAYV
jgi:nucleoside-diphosphate-sugar epimerase